MATIIQKYGPIYGEAVNGTVQGRPNGSVYVPITNTITLSTASDLVKINASKQVFISGGYDVAALSQDLASAIKISLFSDSDLITEFNSRTLPSGQFNGHFAILSKTDKTLVLGDKYYLVATLVNNGVAVATSAVIELEGSE